MIAWILLTVSSLGTLQPQKSDAHVLIHGQYVSEGSCLRALNRLDSKKHHMDRSQMMSGFACVQVRSPIKPHGSH